MATETPETSSSTAPVYGAALPRVRKPGRVPIKSWAPDLEGSALEQATNLSNLPFAIRHVALMPDVHAGYGMPIGGVLFADGTYVGEEVLCVDTVVNADGRWTGVGATTRTRDGSSFGVAGVIQIVEHYTSSRRTATATATIDGVSLDASSVVEGWVDRTTTGYHEVLIGS